MMTKVVTVFGATGNQGGSVISTLLAHPDLGYSIRAITRDATKDSAKALSAKGVEVFEADLNDPVSLTKAISGSHAVFGVTNFWEVLSKDVELQQGKNIANAAKAAGVHHLVWSSLPHTTKTSGGKLSHIAHFDLKAEVEEYIELVKGDMIATHFMPGGFYTNIKHSVQPTPEGATMALPMAGDAHFPLIDVRNGTGKYVVGVLEAGKAADGARIQAVSEWTTPQNLVDVIGEVSGTKVNFMQISPEAFKSFLPETIAAEMTENMQLIGDYSYYGLESDSNQAKSDAFLLKGEKLVSWKEYVMANGLWKW